MDSQHQNIHIPVSVWLQTIDLPQYDSLFARYKGAQELFNITDREVLMLGVQNPEHRSRVISSLQLLGAKCRSNATLSNAAPPIPEPKLTPEQEQQRRRQLMEELKLPSSDMRSLPWFHGKITREKSEQLVTTPGDFIVRESLSQQGSYVLTCNHNSQPLHFVINKFVETSGGGRYSNIEYGFESSRYSSIQALIMAHIGDRAEITSASHARIVSPVNREAPIGAVEEQNRRSLGLSKASSSDYEMTSPSWQIRKPLFYQPSSASQKSVESLAYSPGLKRDPSMERVSSSPQLHAADKGHRSSSNISSSSPRSVTSSGSLLVPDSGLTNKAKSEGELHSTPSQLPQRSAELKTSRNTSAARQPVIAIRNRELYDDGADYSDYYEVKRMPDEAKKTNSQQPSQSLPYNTHNNTNRSPSNVSHNNHQQQDDIGGDDYDTPAPIAVEIHDFIPPMIPTNYIDATNFSTDLLGDQNKPLDPNCMYKMKEALFQVNHQTLSQHITYLDLHLLRVIETRNLGAGIFSGIEALTLPQGQHFRQAAIERHCSLSFIVSVTILACTDDLLERSQMLKQWIMIAKELMRTQGNLFSFGAIMHGVCSPSISRLTQTWNILERSDPVLMNQWRTKIRSTYMELNSASSSRVMDNISIPYVTPFCELYEVQEEMIHSPDVTITGNDDLDSLFAHMDLVRLMASQTSEYSRKGKDILRYFSLRPDLRDLFKVELHMRLLYGHKGAQAKRAERQVKFQQILNILSERAENQDEL